MTLHTIPSFGFSGLMSQEELDKLLDSLPNEDEWIPPEDFMERKIAEISDRIFLGHIDTLNPRKKRRIDNPKESDTSAPQVISQPQLCDKEVELILSRSGSPSAEEILSSTKADLAAKKSSSSSSVI